MSTLDLIVITGESVATARSLDSAVRQLPPFARVIVVGERGGDARVESWLSATAAARRWDFLLSERLAFGALVNAALSRTTGDYVMFVEAGEALRPAATRRLHEALGDAGNAAFVAGAIRLTGLGVDDVFEPDSASPVAIDPAHPSLRSVVWRREVLERLGGLDPDLPAAARYDLWLRAAASRCDGRFMSSVILDSPATEDGPLVAEIGHPAFAAATDTVRARHCALLAAGVCDVLELRARRVNAVGRRHRAALERQQDSERQVQALSRYESLPAGASGWRASGWRASPVSRDWGYERGGPLDRHYIEQFLAAHASDIAGTVLEVQEADYTRRYGGSAVTVSDVVDLSSRNAAATIVTDLRSAANIADDTYDCVILTQTLHVIAAMDEVVAECHRILRPGGVLLLTAPAASRVCLEYGRDGDFWRMTPAGARWVLEAHFDNAVDVTVFGNAGATAAFLQGYGRNDVPVQVLDVVDTYNPMLIGARAIKEGHGAGAPAILRAHAQAAGVLLYHRVGGVDPDPHRLSVDRELFAAEMAWLARSADVLPLSELIGLARRRRLPRRAVAVTFDDGYLDTLETAAPILAAHGIAATCFCTTAGLDGAQAFWWDELAWALLGDGPRQPGLTITLPEGPRSFPVATRGERLLAHGVIYHALIGAPATSRNVAIEELRTWAYGLAPSRQCRRMTADEIRRLASSGVTIGAHTVSHPLLTRLSRSEKVDEIASSCAALERVTGAAVNQLAYPFGAYDDATLEAAAEAGIACACTCEPRAVTSSTLPLRIPRLDVHMPTLDGFATTVDALLAGVG